MSTANTKSGNAILVTGATGFIGQRLAHHLAELGETVHVLIRNINATQFLQHPLIKIFKGDIEDIESVRHAMRGCNRVYHVAGLVRFAILDTSLFYRVNVEGTRNVLEAARGLGIEKVVFTSTTGVIGPSLTMPMSEDDPRITGYDNHYEITKHLAEVVVREFYEQGVQAVIVSPSRVYGPGITTYSNGVNRFILGFIKKKFAVIPICDDVTANYVYIDDVVKGHVLAMQSGIAGEKYILGGENISFRDFTNVIRTQSGIKGVFIKIPKSLIKAGASGVQIKAWILRQAPELTPRVVDRLFQNFSFSSDKAVRDLGYIITPFSEGIQKTIAHLKT